MTLNLAPEAGTAAARMARIEELLSQAAALPDPAARSCAEELMRVVLELHGAGLGRMLELLHGSDAEVATPLLTAFAADDLVRSLLFIHDLHPVPLQARLEQALNEVRPMMRAHKGGVELLGIDAGVVRLRLEGSCDGCPASSATMRNAVEQAIMQHAPDIEGIEVEGLVEQPLQAAAIDCLKPLPMASGVGAGAITAGR